MILAIGDDNKKQLQHDVLIKLGYAALHLTDVMLATAEAMNGGDMIGISNARNVENDVYDEIASRSKDYMRVSCTHDMDTDKLYYHDYDFLKDIDVKN